MSDEDNTVSQLWSAAYLKIENFAWAEIERETKQKKLHYHTIDHAYAVKRRANTIFNAIKPVLLTKIESRELDRIEYLINICAITHDMVQEFSSSLENNTTRKRPFGLSETATIDKLVDYIKQINRDLSPTNSQPIAVFSEQDIDSIKEAIGATICHYNYLNDYIYQPYLYQTDKKLSLTAQIIALADLGTLGMEGIEPYLEEGILLFLEEHPGIADFFSEQKHNQSNQNLTLAKLEESTLATDLKKQLLKSTRSMIRFAKSRKANFPQEITSFDETLQHILRDRVFIYLTDENVRQIESIVPTEDNVSLSQLLEFFNFDRYV